MKQDARGFTLPELMIVVSIVAILAAIAVPKFASLLRKSNEGATKGSLGTLRSALGIYYADMEGQFPSDLGSLTLGAKYLQAMPLARTPGYHAATADVVAWNGGAGTDAGGWMYDGIAGDAQAGSVLVNCVETDARGASWSSY